MARVSKDGVNFYDIDDSDESLSAAEAKGYKRFIQMTKDGEKVFDVEATEDSYKAAVEKGYKEVELYNFTKDVNKPSVADSVFRGAISGLSQGYDDELGGALEAAGSAVGLRGVGSSNLLDIRAETDEEDSQSFKEIYKAARDKRRNEKEVAEKANPKAYMTGDIGGGVATGVLAPATNTLKGSVALGGIAGLGRSNADITEGEIVQSGIDTVAGASMGAAGYVAGKGVEKGAKALASGASGAIETSKQLVKGIGRGAARGAKEAVEDVPDVIGIKEGAGVYGGLKGIWDELKGLSSTTKEIKNIAKEARDIIAQQKKVPGRIQDLQAFGNAKSLSDDEAISVALLLDGDNAVKKWVAEKAAVTTGQIDGDSYSKLLNMPAADRATARAFSAKEAAKSLRPAIEEVDNLFKEARNARFSELQNAARSSFDDANTPAVLSELKLAIEDANSLKSIPSNIRGLLDDINGMIVEGRGTRLQGLQKGEWDVVSNAEKFNRLQKARELLDQKIKWAQKEAAGQAESLLRGVRDKIDDALKISPEKLEADELFKASKDIEGRFFGTTEFRNPGGKVEIDEGKISRLFGDNDRAGRFREALQDLKTFSARDDLPAPFRAKAANLIDSLEKQMEVAGNQRAINNFRFKQGPTSPAIERMQSVTGKNSVLKDAVTAPAGFLNSADQLLKTVEKKMGKPLSAMTPAEQKKAIQYWVALKNQESPNLEAIEKFLKAP